MDPSAFSSSVFRKWRELKSDKRAEPFIITTRLASWKLTFIWHLGPGVPVSTRRQYLECWKRRDKHPFGRWRSASGKLHIVAKSGFSGWLAPLDYHTHLYYVCHLLFDFPVILDLWPPLWLSGGFSALRRGIECPRQRRQCYSSLYKNISAECQCSVYDTTNLSSGTNDSSINSNNSNTTEFAKKWVHCCHNWLGGSQCVM